MMVAESRSNALQQGKTVAENVIIVDENVVIPLYNPPHLVKSLRNNLLTKDLQYMQDGVNKTAKWSHMKDAYYIDLSVKLRNMPKLTDMHVLPSKLKKMKVSTCTQVFSQNIASTIDLMARTICDNRAGKATMTEDAEDTADLCSFQDELFDSMNADTSKEKTGKILRRAVTQK
ncbi:hypothetical protein QE152_g38172 [Popillia japonica]|uniref:Transposable element P transposase-like GTP-binding insertion domain-containing protein n=1 Tax=Popillia japonica TaxID=7064 RepID=A0AAW1I898_POPJA